MRKLDIPIIPGSMISDVVETDLGIAQHEEVQNLRQNKLGEWETVKGYIEHLTGATNLINGIEITFDENDDRFLLMQEGTTLIRIDYDSGYDYADVEVLTLPSDVSILSTQKLRFFSFRGVVRITGAVLTADNTVHVPLWYGYIDRDIERLGTTDIEHTGWYLTKATVDLDPDFTMSGGIIGEFISTDTSGSGSDESEFETVYVKVFYISDRGQFSLLKDIDQMVTFHVKTTNLTHLAYAINFQLLLPYDSGGDELFEDYPRFTGLAICIGSKALYDTDADVADIVNWEVVDVLDMTDQDNREISWVDCFYDTSFTLIHDDTFDKTQVIVTHGRIDNDTNEATFRLLQAHFMADAPVTIVGPAGTVTTTVNSTNMAQIVDGGVGSIWMEMYFNDAVTSAFNSDPETQVQVDFVFPKVYFPGATLWRYNVILDLVGYSGTDFADYTDILASSEDIDPAYSHHAIINERAFCLSLEDEEEDVVRYSPLYQFDVFPNANIIQTQVGDADNNVAIVKRSDRLMILKHKSISQIQFIGDNYYEDVGFADNGIYSTNDGYISILDTVYWMDKDDIYAYSGGIKPTPLMQALDLRKLYRQYVDEDSYLAYDKLENELWVILDEIIFVYQVERKAWYIRDTDILPTFAFRDYDKNLIVGANTALASLPATTTKLVNYNHSLTDFDEAINYKIITKIIDLYTPEKTKKTEELTIPIVSNYGVKVTVDDPDKSQSKNDTKTPDTSEIKVTRFWMQYLFKQLQITFENGLTGGDQSDMLTKIRRMKMKLDVW